mmetsp:Transcript_11513/g.11498  ORF Transcript_11513/g.11498 Transcript_11513/m.11498 type:complete len:95 (+) Transcript_11513:36-320(+)
MNDMFELCEAKLKLKEYEAKDIVYKLEKVDPFHAYLAVIGKGQLSYACQYLHERKYGTLSDGPFYDFVSIKLVRAEVDAVSFKIDAKGTIAFVH